MAKGKGWGSTGLGGPGKAPSGQGYPGPGPKAGDSGLNKGSAGKPAPHAGCGIKK